MKNLNTTTTFGLFYLLIALISFQLFNTINVHQYDFLCIIFVFSFVVIYFIQLIIAKVKNKKRNVPNNAFDWLLLLTILEISSFNLNKVIPIFAHSANWVTFLLTITNVAMGYLLFPNQTEKNPILKKIATIIAASGIPLFIYFSIFLFPYSIYSIIGLLFFGLSIHVFTPLIFTIFFIYHLSKNTQKTDFSNWKYLTIGIVTPIIITIIFSEYWTIQTKKINQIINHKTINDNPEFPNWVEIAQQLPKNSITEKILKTGIVYPTYNDHSEFLFQNPLNQNTNEIPKHDPLVNIANAFSASTNLEENEKLKIIKCQYGRNYQFNEHLWGDEFLQTSAIVTNVLLMPQYRLAYTEKTITIQNTEEYNRGEAIYTFQLPANSAVSSLSLWINGEERKAAITTKLKAETAYKQIVGVEMRDPVTVSWKEGNSVIVRIFPCTKESPRKFKLGITSPLEFNTSKNTLTYRNIIFEGPNPEKAAESIKINTETPLENLSSDNISNAVNEIIDQNYKENWSYTFKAPNLSINQFNFQNQSYRVVPIVKSQVTTQFKQLYLDINATWTQNEINEALNLPGQKYIYVNHEFLEQGNANFKKGIESLKKFNFSVFPYYKIKDPTFSLVVTQNSSNTPNIEDLRLTSLNFNDTTKSSSEFHKKLNQWLQSSNQINVFALNQKPGNLVQSLSDIHAINVYQGNTTELVTFVKNQTHFTEANNDTVVSIPSAKISIVKQNNTNSKSIGSNHILRLFAYNHTMLNIGKKYITQPEKVTENQIQEAISANVVTPVSNLIVLETKEDYDRFKIKEIQNNSLENANMKSSGSVPEPHDWLLIILGLTFVFTYTVKQWK